MYNLSRVKAIQSSRISADKAVSSVKLRRLELDSFEKKKNEKGRQYCNVGAKSNFLILTVNFAMDEMVLIQTSGGNKVINMKITLRICKR